MRADLAPADDIAAVVRGAGGESLVVVIQPGRDPLSLARTLASLTPLAIERAPGLRVNAVLAEPGAASASVAAAATFLESAASTTGQLLTVS